MTEPEKMTHSSPAFDPSQITRPDPVLLKYYFLSALITGPGFPFVFLYLYFKYHTLKYSFDESGVSMAWGILFRQEIHLTYRRIQDIHLTRNIVQRWMNLATVAIQTASGSSGPEMSVEGILAAEPLRDYLYAQMRGVHGEVSSGLATEPDTISDADEALNLLKEIRDLLKHRSSEPGSKI